MSPQPSEPEITIPSFDFDEPAPVQEQQPITPLGSSGEYTVEKDDTLQKISKKFYGTYSQWSKIYEANKERIENPDSIQPGIVIVIPPVE
ncbi:MAG TPA: hypothetical protein DD723_04120 [Candidatus Omnitrophica bacterium]|nr:hypothetical protein [Candidatus Omnitrophota bacterium]